ncbi:MAG: GntR family transcriptional regulator, partial [Chitinivibrionales bacterium]|nr:GntR family transcriptional regulator [Chitinivibrionales bacterium]
ICASGGTAAPPSPQAPARGGIRATTARRLAADVVKGVYRPGEALPRMADLCDRYGVCSRTMRKVLSSLHEDRWLERQLRGYRVAMQTAPPSRNRIVLIARGSQNFRFGGAGAPHLAEEYRYLEQKCIQAGLKLDIVHFDYDTDNRFVDSHGRSTFVPRADSLATTLGFMVWDQGLRGLGLDDLIARLSAYGKPVAILDVDGIDFGKHIQTGSLTRVFTLGRESLCGEVVGRYLLGLGHRTVVFLSCADFLDRYRGIEKEYRKAGLDHGVALVRGDTGVPGSGPVTTRVVAAALSDRNNPLYPLRESIVMNLDRIATSQEALNALYGLERLCEKALSVPHATAWVAESDYVALRALQFLADRGMQVPRDLSVIGFDDIEIAFHNGLTTYNFNIEAIMQAMVEHILRPVPYSPSRGPGKRIVIEGRVISRRTTARAPLRAESTS